MGVQSAARQPACGFNLLLQPTILHPKQVTPSKVSRRYFPSLSTKALDITPNLEPLFGTRDENLRLMEDMLRVRIDLRPDAVVVEGSEESVARVERIFGDYEALRRAGYNLHNGELNGMLRLVVADPAVTLRSLAETGKQRRPASSAWCSRVR